MDLITLLSNEANPLGLKAYWPLVRGLNDKMNGYNLAATGTVVSPHCRVFLPHGV